MKNNLKLTNSLSRQKELFKPLTKWNEIIDDPKNLGNIIRNAFKQSSSERPGASHICFPFDVQEAEISEEDIWINKEFTKFPALPLKPDISKIKQIVEEISKSKNPIIICGGAIKNSFAEKDLQRLVGQGMISRGDAAKIADNAELFESAFF